MFNRTETHIATGSGMREQRNKLGKHWKGLGEMMEIRT